MATNTRNQGGRCLLVAQINVFSQRIQVGEFSMQKISTEHGQKQERQRPDKAKHYSKRCDYKRESFDSLIELSEMLMDSIFFFDFHSF